MNELYRNLAVQAITYKSDGSGTDIPKAVFDKEKFAELIVRECIHVALKDSYPNWDKPASEANVQCVKIAADLREHFGVTE